MSNHSSPTSPTTTHSPNPQSGSTVVDGNSSSWPSSPNGKTRRELPPLFWYMELGDWERATARAKSHPKEVKTRATLRTKSMAEDGTKVSGTKRLALHHACFKLRSAGSLPVPPPTSTPNNSNNKKKKNNAGGETKKMEDPFVSVCKFVLLLLEIYPDACQVRESRHGCLPLHLAAFASCYIRPPSNDDDDDEEDSASHNQIQINDSHAKNKNDSSNNNNAAKAGAGKSKTTISSSSIARPRVVSARSNSTSSASSNMTAILMEENFAAAQTFRKKEGYAPPSVVDHAAAAAAAASSTQQPQGLQSPSPQQQQTQEDATPSSPPSPPKQTIFISNKREQMAVKVLNAMLDAYPRAIRLDSEGGRLPLHTACAGRATPRCVSLILRAYPAAARHRNKDGFLPLHLAAHWGVSHPNVAITLLKAYPDATVGRNRWERTPLEEALVMAGENGRPHQAPLVRALRKHPSYWTRPPKELFQAGNNGLDRSVTDECNLVDMDVTLASGDDDGTSMDDNPNYFNAGHSRLIEDEYENVPEGEETGDTKGATVGRLRRKSNKDVDISQNVATLIKNLRWKSAIARLELNPDEANNDLVGVMTRGGFQASANMTPLHYACERKPPIEVIEALLEANPEAVAHRMMPGGCLPLHVACTWHASPAVISLLLSADPTTAKAVDELGNRPLHTACFSGVALAIIQGLLTAYPKAVLARNNQGSQPIDICRRLRHPNRRAVMTALLEKKDYVVARQNHRRSKSSGSMNGLAEQAAQLNSHFGTPTTGKNPKFDHVDESNECMPGVGVEVTYEGQDKSQPLLWI